MRKNHKLALQDKIVCSFPLIGFAAIPYVNADILAIKHVVLAEDAG